MSMKAAFSTLLFLTAQAVTLSEITEKEYLSEANVAINGGIKSINYRDDRKIR